MTSHKRERRPARGAVIVNLVENQHHDHTATESLLQRQLAADIDRESRIDTLRLQLSAARDPEIRRDVWQRLRTEVAERAAQRGEVL